MMNILLCKEVTEKCRLNESTNCPGIDGEENDGLRSILHQIIDETLIENISFKQWTSVGIGVRLNRVELPVIEFINDVCAKLEKLNQHDFISVKQSSYFKNSKDNLNQDEVIAVMDFSENIAFEMQDAAQSYYYEKIQCTIHPICMYLKKKR